MNAKSALDSIVARIAAIDVHLSGDDSPLANPWEEIKEQLQTRLCPDWEAYLITIEQTISGFVFELAPPALTELSASLRCSQDEIEQRLLQRILQRGKREKVRYRPFDFTYFCYPLPDFTVYAKVIERTGWQSCVVLAYSAAAPNGERGEVITNDIEYILTQEDFENAGKRGWPERWKEEHQPAQASDEQLSLFEIPAADAAKVSEEDFDAPIKKVIAESVAEATAGSVSPPSIPEGKKPAPAGARAFQPAGATFDEETWSRAKPLFAQAFEEFKAAGKSLNEFIGWAIDRWQHASISTSSFLKFAHLNFPCKYQAAANPRLTNSTWMLSRRVAIAMERWGSISSVILVSSLRLESMYLGNQPHSGCERAWPQSP